MDESVSFQKRFIKGDKTIWFVFISFCIISALEVFSAASMLTYKSGDYWEPFRQHCIYLLGGIGVALVIAQLVNYKFLKLLVLLVPLSAILLLIVLASGKTINDASRWISLFGISFQPSELAKLGVVATVAFVLAKCQENAELRKKAFWIILGVTVIICGLIVSENFSTAGLLFVVVFLMMIVGRIDWKRLVILFLGGLLVATIFLHLPIRRAETWRNRIEDKITSFGVQVPPEKYVITDDNNQATHATIAIATSGLFGKIPGKSVQRDFLPQAFSDFIFVIIIEELGLMGGALVIVLYLILFFRVGMIAQKCHQPFPAFLIIGIAFLILVQALVNMLVAVGIGPVTGQPLPLISKGGTSTLINAACIGIILSVSNYTQKLDELKAQSIEGENAQKIIDEVDEANGIKE